MLGARRLYRMATLNAGAFQCVVLHFSGWHSATGRVDGAFAKLWPQTTARHADISCHVQVTRMELEVAG